VKYYLRPQVGNRVSRDDGTSWCSRIKPRDKEGRRCISFVAWKVLPCGDKHM